MAGVVSGRRGILASVATKRGGGGGKVVDLTVKILQDIRAQLGGLKDIQAELRELRASQERTNAKLDQLDRSSVEGFTAVAKRVDALGARIDNLRDIAGDRTRDHEERLGSAEQRLDRLEARVAKEH